MHKSTLTVEGSAVQFSCWSLKQCFLGQESDKKMSFSGKVVLITGAGSGIGAETARHLAKLEASVSIVDINANRLSEVAEQIIKSGLPKPLPIVADVTKDPERIIDETVKHFGRLDVLVNNAGIFASDSAINFDASTFDRVMNVNLRSAIILTNLAVPHLEKTKGNIVNVSSVAGLRMYREFTSYCISKAGLNQFTQCAALDLAPKKIRVNAVNPGLIPTPIYEAIGVNNSNANKFFEDNGCLVDRTGHVSDISTAIAYLANETFVNGTLLTVDGGFLCATPPSTS